MIDHVTIFVSDLEKSKHFYERAFEPGRLSPNSRSQSVLA